MELVPLQGKASVPVDAKLGPVFEAEIRTKMTTQTTTEPFVALCKLFRKLELVYLMKEQLGQTIEFDAAEIIKTPLTTIFKEITSVINLLLAPSHLCRSSSSSLFSPKTKDFQGMLYEFEDDTPQEDSTQTISHDSYIIAL